MHTVHTHKCCTSTARFAHCTIKHPSIFRLIAGSHGPWVVLWPCDQVVAPDAALTCIGCMSLRQGCLLLPPATAGYHRLLRRWQASTRSSQRSSTYLNCWLLLQSAKVRAGWVGVGGEGHRLRTTRRHAHIAHAELDSQQLQQHVPCLPGWSMQIVSTALLVNDSLRLLHCPWHACTSGVAAAASTAIMCG